MKHLLVLLMFTLSSLVLAVAPKNGGVQVQEYVYDFAEDGGAQSTITLSSKSGSSPLPVGAIVVAVHTRVETALTSGGSAVLSWGNGDDADGYSGAAAAVAGFTANALNNGWDNAAALIWDDTNDHQIPLYIDDVTTGAVSFTIGTADLTAGKVVILVEYYADSLS